MNTTRHDWQPDASDPNDELVGQVVEQAAEDSIDSYSTVLLGEPFDRAVIGRKGAAEGPGAIRDELASVKTHHFEHGAVDSIGDLGDIQSSASSVEAIQKDCLEAVDLLHTSEVFPVFLGGDNSLSYANVRPMLDLYESVGVVSLDAHLDCREPVDGPSSGTPYRQLFDDGLDHLTVCGARHFETSTAYADYLDSQGGQIITAERIMEDLDACLDRVMDALDNVEAAYFSLDMDVLDAAAAPGVSAPTPGGITTRELFSLVGALAGHEKVQGFEIVETAPPLDTERQTVKAAARAVTHALAGRDSA